MGAKVVYWAVNVFTMNLKVVYEVVNVILIENTCELSYLL
jgi:hypothetical protein